MALFENQYLTTTTPIHFQDSEKIVSSQTTVQKKIFSSRANKTQSLINRYKKEDRSKKINLLKNIKESKIPHYDSKF